MEGELTKSGDARTARSGSRCTRLVDGYTSRTVRCIPVFVRSQYSDALVGVTASSDLSSVWSTQGPYPLVAKSLACKTHQKPRKTLLRSARHDLLKKVT